MIVNTDLLRIGRRAHCCQADQGLCAVAGHMSQFFDFVTHVDADRFFDIACQRTGFIGADHGDAGQCIHHRQFTDICRVGDNVLHAHCHSYHSGNGQTGRNGDGGDGQNGRNNRQYIGNPREITQNGYDQQNCRNQQNGKCDQLFECRKVLAQSGQGRHLVVRVVEHQGIFRALTRRNNQSFALAATDAAAGVDHIDAIGNRRDTVERCIGVFGNVGFVSGKDVFIHKQIFGGNETAVSRNNHTRFQKDHVTAYNVSGTDRDGLTSAKNGNGSCLCVGDVVKLRGGVFLPDRKDQIADER